MSALKLGSKGKRVYVFQEKLQKLGYDPGEIDGYFGYKTLEALAYLRRDLHLPPYGKADRQLFWYLKTRKNLGNTYYRDQDEALKRVFNPKVGVLGTLNGADFVLDYLDNDKSRNKVLIPEKTPFMATTLLKIRKYPFFIAFSRVKGQKKTELFSLGRKAQGFIYLPWSFSTDFQRPILEEQIPEKIQILLRDFAWKDLYLGIPLNAFEWLLETEKEQPKRSSSRRRKLIDSEVVEGYPLEKPYDETMDFLRKRGVKGKKLHGEIVFQFRQNQRRHIIKILSTQEIKRLVKICDSYHLSGVIFWQATQRDDRLWHLNIPKQL